MNNQKRAETAQRLQEASEAAKADSKYLSEILQMVAIAVSRNQEEAIHTTLVNGSCHPPNKKEFCDECGYSLPWPGEGIRWG